MLNQSNRTCVAVKTETDMKIQLSSKKIKKHSKQTTKQAAQPISKDMTVTTNKNKNVHHFNLINGLRIIIMNLAYWSSEARLWVGLCYQK